MLLLIFFGGSGHLLVATYFVGGVVRVSISVFDLFSIGVGPSSSHTIGPMRAAKKIILDSENLINDIANITVELFGSLALTGKGHGTVWSIMLGLEGEEPKNANPKNAEKIRNSKKIKLLGKREIPFSEDENFIFHLKERLPKYSNAMRFSLYDKDKNLLEQKIYYSVGGGFIIEDGEKEETPLEPYYFMSAEELLSLCDHNNMTIAEIVFENEKMWRPIEEVEERLLEIWEIMNQCIENGCNTSGMLPGILKLPRRAPELYQQLIKDVELDFSDVFDRISLYAIAVAEENASGGRIVTAPTNGAAGIIPAVLRYYLDCTNEATDDDIIEFLLVAGAVGILYKIGASISGAEVGCQGEVGVACSMAAAGLASVLGGTKEQIENAAEIGMEHNLGLTCDPVAGLVQIPCIERNAMGAVKAVNAARLALKGDGKHKISLDNVILTMRQTGADMRAIYKETSQGGLAVNVPVC